MNQLRKTFKVIKNRDFYKVSKYIHKYRSNKFRNANRYDY